MTKFRMLEEGQNPSKEPLQPDESRALLLIIVGVVLLLGGVACTGAIYVAMKLL